LVKSVVRVITKSSALLRHSVWAKDLNSVKLVVLSLLVEPPVPLERRADGLGLQELQVSRKVCLFLRFWVFGNYFYGWNYFRWKSS
jgi:hypothetical protein